MSFANIILAIKVFLMAWEYVQRHQDKVEAMNALKERLDDRVDKAAAARNNPDPDGMLDPYDRANRDADSK